MHSVYISLMSFFLSFSPPLVSVSLVHLSISTYFALCFSFSFVSVSVPLSLSYTPPSQNTRQHQYRADEAKLNQEEEEVNHNHMLPGGISKGGDEAGAVAATATAVSAGALSEEPATFESLGLCDWLLTACKAMGFRRPTPVQHHCIPAVSVATANCGEVNVKVSRSVGRPFERPSIRQGRRGFFHISVIQAFGAEQGRRSLLASAYSHRWWHACSATILYYAMLILCTILLYHSTILCYTVGVL